MRSAADREGEVGDYDEVPYFLDGHVHDRFAPAYERLGQFRQDTVLACALEAERGVEVAAHQCVFDLGRIGEKVKNC